MQSKLLQVQGIKKNFSGVRALRGVDLSIKKGEIHSLIGENGSGKSTLIKIISGVLAPDSGSITIGQDAFSRLTPIMAIRRGIQVIYQDFSLFPNLTVAENLALNSELADGAHLVAPKRIRKIARESLDKLSVEIDLDLPLERLSVAQQQLIAISRALVQKTQLIIMDEPTAALTYREVQQLYQVVRLLKEAEVSVLFVSHKLEEVLQVSDQISVIREGRKVAEGGPDELDASQLVYYMTGRRLERQHKTRLPKHSDESPLLRVENLTRRRSYQNISFDLRKGEILGLTGLLGSGQGPLALGLFGLLPADSGQIWVSGIRRKILKVRDALLAGIGFVPEDRLTEGLFLNQSIEKNLQASRLEEFVEYFLLDQSRMRVDSVAWVEKLNISLRSLLAPVKTLSGGNQQKIMLARWLSRDPKILVLHNPTSGVDVASKHDIHQLIRNLSSQGTGVLIISDDLPEILGTCDRILLMKKGELSEELSPDGLTEARLMERIMA